MLGWLNSETVLTLLCLFIWEVIGMASPDDSLDEEKEPEPALGTLDDVEEEHWELAEGSESGMERSGIQKGHWKNDQMNAVWNRKKWDAAAAGELRDPVGSLGWRKHTAEAYQRKGGNSSSITYMDAQGWAEAGGTELARLLTRCQSHPSYRVALASAFNQMSGMGWVVGNNWPFSCHVHPSFLWSWLSWSWTVVHLDFGLVCGFLNSNFGLGLECGLYGPCLGGKWGPWESTLRAWTVNKVLKISLHVRVLTRKGHNGRCLKIGFYLSHYICLDLKSNIFSLPMSLCNIWNSHDMAQIGNST